MANKKISFNPEEGMDQFITELARISRESSKGVYVANLNRQNEFYEALKTICKDIISNDIRITYGIESAPFDGSGYISVAARRITAINPQAFVRIMRGASNVEFCSKTDGTVEITLMYYRLYEKVSNMK